MPGCRVCAAIDATSVGCRSPVSPGNLGRAVSVAKGAPICRTVAVIESFAAYQSGLSRREVASVWAGWLHSFKWSFFATTSYRLPRLNSYLASKSYFGALDDVCAPDRVFLAFEPHAKGDLHCHALVHVDHDGWRGKAIDGLSRWDATKPIWAKLFKRFGHTRVEVIRKSEQVSLYVSKYVSKGEAFDYYLGGSGRGWGHPLYQSSPYSYVLPSGEVRYFAGG